MDSTATLRRNGRQRDVKIPLILRPLLRAYILGYASAVAPRLLTLLLQHLTRLRQASRKQVAATTVAEGDESHPQQRNHDAFLESMVQILRNGLDPRRFATFCAVIVGGSTLLEVSVFTPYFKARLPYATTRSR